VGVRTRSQAKKNGSLTFVKTALKSYRLTTSLLLILDAAMPKLTMYSTMLFWKTSVGDFIQIVTASPISRPIGPSGDNTLVPCRQELFLDSEIKKYTLSDLHVNNKLLSE